MRVKEVMAQPIVTAPEDVSVEEVARIIMDRRVACVPLTDASGRLSTMSDFAPKEEGQPATHFRSGPLFNTWLADGSAAAWFKQNKSRPARAIMSSPVVSVDEDDDVQVAINRMAGHGLYRLPVVREGRPVGMVSQRDLLRVMLGAL